MNWKMFFGGIAMIVAAFLLRKLDIWVYGKDGQERDTYNFLQNVKGKIISVLLTIIGLIIILVSFAGNSNF